ncbi:MAG: flagellar hook protein FlgE, partial [Gammaproteobacteria bacterium]|nr:flagellar hook protein FlgE [Gammaproteobacteria bacterium]
FGIDRDGFVVDSQARRLQIFPITNTGSFNTGALTDLQLSTTDSPPQASAFAEFGINLPADAQPPSIPVFDPANASTFNHSTSITIYDSLGATHNATVYFVRTATANTWDAYFYIDGNAVGGANTLQYSNFGALQTPATGTFVLPSWTPPNGAADIDLSANFSLSTQFGSEFGVNSLNQDGFAAGRLADIDVDANGVIFARFTNGRSDPLGQVALSNFNNPQGLRQVGNTSWAETFASGDTVRGAAGTASFGLIQSGALEASNVDLTEQLVNMITAQRNFQANAQMISTADQVTQTIINIR